MAQPTQRPAPKDKRRRRRQMAVLVLGYVIMAIGLAWFLESRATTTILFVRHAETGAPMGDSDPDLNAAGRARAQSLAEFVRNIDVVASVDAVYASEFKRTQQTAAPLARQLGIDVAIADHYAPEAFMAEVLREHKGEIVLVVSHSDAIAPLIEELHGSKNIAPIGADDFDNFFIVTSPSFGKVKTLQLHYGQSKPGALHSAE